jgi:very-short-patch-repair endonuclease
VSERGKSPPPGGEVGGPQARRVGGPIHLHRARELRTRATDAERKLWFVLRTLRRSHGFHFRRQVPVGPFIVDFACHKRRMIIEADGAHHDPDADASRDLWFRKAGYATLRFTNYEIFREFDGVVRTIEHALGIDGGSADRG